MTAPTSSTRPRPPAPDPSVPRPLVWTGLPRAPGAWFDEAAVERVLRFMRLLRHTQGRYAGAVFEPLAWQIEYVFRPLFGWRRPDGTRLIRTAWLEFPRKNGKSFKSSALALYLWSADEEPGAQVYAAAASRDQANVVFAPSRDMAMACKPLATRAEIQRAAMYLPRTRSIYRVLAADAPNLHGLNVHGAVIDEVHIHKRRDLVDTLETGTGSRTQPLVIFITTADEGEPGSIYDEKRSYVERIAKGLVEDDSFYGVVYAAEETDDPFDERTWEKANPGIDVTVSRDYLRAQAVRARHSPAYLSTFRRLHLGIRTRAAKTWLGIDAWDASAGLVAEEHLGGRKAWGGLDLASTTDLAALAWILPAEDGSVDCIWRFWLPSSRLADLDERTAGQASVWVREGTLRLCEGDVIVYATIREQIRADRGRFASVAEIAYDPWQAAQLAQELDEDGLTMVEHRQTYAQMSRPSKELERLILARKFRHGGNPIARWMFHNVRMRVDENENIRPDRRKSRDKIDGIVAAIMGVGGATAPSDDAGDPIAMIVKGGEA